MIVWQILTMPWKIFPSFLPHNTRNLASWIFVCHQNFTVLFTPFKYNSMLQIKQVYFKRLLLKCIYNQINCMFIVVCDLGVSGLFWPKNLYKKNWQNSQWFWTISYLHMSKNVTIPPIHILLTRTRSISNISNQIF